MGKDLKGKELGVGLYQRTDGRYEARATIRGIKIDIYGSNLAELKKDFKDAKEKAQNNIDVKLQSVTLDQWFYEWFDKYKKPKMKSSSYYPTISRYKSTFSLTLGNTKLKDIRNLHIQGVVNKLIEEGRAASSVRSSLGILRDCLESARNNRIIDFNPCFEIIVPWLETKAVMRRFLTPVEQARFLKQVENDYYKEMYYIMFFTGMRIGEVGGLLWSDVDFVGKCFNISRSLLCNYEKGVKTCVLTTPKTANSYRRIPFIEDVEQMLLSWKKKQDVIRKDLGDRWRSKNTELDDLVFTTSMGSPVTRYLAEKNVNNIVDAINYEDAIAHNGEEEYTPMEKVYPHAIRHTFCSRCFESGMNPKVVQALMGHANYSTTIDIYTHVTQGFVDKDIAKFGKIQLTQPE